ncbi:MULTISPECIES: ABC transporter permease [unclassified Mesorhizobium]|uniref:ABC transporter permease n=1 Tax=unclassified Mesorhizobium TaxID=325217 RepID=UPI0011268FE0|nr:MULTISPECIES: ABC transporter permease [unclassified Mesorhizobium]MBZ9811288.1 ABC transporter permease [Mesorhizobium sp. ESP-6-2]TPM25861.1 ABC transporter permease [Mesorhizobium sp. B2-2-2]
MPRIIALITRHPTSVVLLVCVLVSAAANNEFLTSANLYNLLRQIAPAGIVALGMAIVIIAAGIDLSMGAMAALAGVIVLTIQSSAGSATGVALALAAGAGAGLANGLAVTSLRINPFIGSLATTMVLRGASLTISNSQTITGQDLWFGRLADYAIFGVPVAAILFGAIFAILYFITTSTPIGRALFAVGGSTAASRAAGLKVDRILMLAYVTAGFLAAVAGVMISSQINSGSPIIGDRIPLFAIAAVLIGGVSMHGGAGSLLGVIQGVIVLAVIQNGMNLYGIGGQYQITAIGLLLIITMMFDEFLVRQRRKASAL